MSITTSFKVYMHPPKTTGSGFDKCHKRRSKEENIGVQEREEKEGEGGGRSKREEGEDLG